MFKKPIGNEKRDDDDKNKIVAHEEDDGEKFLNLDYDFQDFAMTVQNKLKQQQKEGTMNKNT